MRIRSLANWKAIHCQKIFFKNADKDIFWLLLSIFSWNSKKTEIKVIIQQNLKITYQRNGLTSLSKVSKWKNENIHSHWRNRQTPELALNVKISVLTVLSTVTIPGYYSRWCFIGIMKRMCVVRRTRKLRSRRSAGQRTNQLPMCFSLYSGTPWKP